MPKTDAPMGRQRRLAHHRIVRKLGEGAMGIVYAAVDEKLGRKVAIKLLRERSDAVARRRFIREARALAHLSHPNVVQIHDIGEHDDQIFIVMEYIEGTDLGTWLQQAPRSYMEIVEVFIAAGRGLMAAHASGIVHRDFKPANVMIGDDGRIRVVDFGVARGEPLDVLDNSGTWDSSESELRELTESGARVGTPAYMAPEQLRGAEASRATDQFNFCVALWEALYGVRPFSAKTMPAALAMMDAGEFMGEPDSARVPSWLRAVVARGLAARPEDRWPSLAALIEALGRPRRRVVDWANELGAVALLVVGLFTGYQVSEMRGGEFERMTLADNHGDVSQPDGDELRGKGGSVIERPLQTEQLVSEPAPEIAEPPQTAEPPATAEPLEIAEPPPSRSKPSFRLDRRDAQVAGDVQARDISLETQTMAIPRSRCSSLLSCLRPHAIPKAPRKPQSP